MDGDEVMDGYDEPQAGLKLIINGADISDSSKGPAVANYEEAFEEDEEELRKLLEYFPRLVQKCALDPMKGSRGYVWAREGKGAHRHRDHHKMRLGGSDTPDPEVQAYELMGIWEEDYLDHLTPVELPEARRKIAAFDIYHLMDPDAAVKSAKAKLQRVLKVREETATKEAQGAVKADMQKELQAKIQGRREEEEKLLVIRRQMNTARQAGK
eukprot:gene7498-8925_t